MGVVIEILIIEDDPVVALKLESLVHVLGYSTIKTIDNSEDAINFISAHYPDIIVMDINIKGKMDGIEVSETIKNYQIPIIFVTANDAEDTFLRAQEQQPIAYLVKPFNKFTFQSAIETAVRKLSNADKTEDAWNEGVWTSKSFFVKRNNLLQRVRTNEILYIKSDGNYCEIMGERKYAVKISLSQILKKLPVNQFLRIHQRYAIQGELIDNIDIVTNEVQIGGHYLPIGPKYKSNILNFLKKI